MIFKEELKAAQEAYQYFNDNIREILIKNILVPSHNKP